MVTVIRKNLILLQSIEKTIKVLKKIPENPKNIVINLLMLLFQLATMTQNKITHILTPNVLIHVLEVVLILAHLHRHQNLPI